MILILIVLTEILLLYLYYTYETVYFMMTTVLFLVYFVVKYNDNDHTTGFRTWPWLRNRTLCGIKSVRHYLGDKGAFDRDDRQMLFLVVGNQTNMGLIDGFCMHGGRFKHLDLVVMLPSILFWIPLVRDALLWMGGVSDRCDVLTLLRKGKSVVWCPSRMDDVVDPGEVKVPEASIFEFAMKHKVPIVPVFISGEQRRYTIPRLRGVQRWCYARIGWPFPFCFFPKRRDQLIDIQIGTPMDGSCYDNPARFLELFMDQFSEDVRGEVLIKV